MAPRPLGALVLAAILLLATGAHRASAVVERPQYVAGDFWSYRTNFTEAVGLRLEGNTTIEAGDVLPVEILGSEVNALEVLLTGGGAFGGDVGGFGTVNGTWTIEGTEYWEASDWVAVRSFGRIQAEGELSGTPPVDFTFSVVNDTRRQVLSDTWTHPFEPGDSGILRERWNATTNVTVSFAGFPPTSNVTEVDGTFATSFSHVRAETTTVPAGTFATDVIREDRPEGGYLLRWLSSAVGNDVREEGYNETGDRVSSAELVDYRYAHGEPTADEFPWLLVLLAVPAVAIVLLLAILMRRKKPPVDVWMPEEPSP